MTDRQVDLGSMTLEQLKATAYDETIKLQVAQQNLHILNQQIMKVMNTPPVKVKDNKVKEVEKIKC